MRVAMLVEQKLTHLLAETKAETKVVMLGVMQGQMQVLKVEMLRQPTQTPQKGNQLLTMLSTLTPKEIQSLSTT